MALPLSSTNGAVTAGSSAYRRGALFVTFLSVFISLPTQTFGGVVLNDASQKTVLADRFRFSGDGGPMTTSGPAAGQPVRVVVRWASSTPPPSENATRPGSDSPRSPKSPKSGAKLTEEARIVAGKQSSTKISHGKDFYLERRPLNSTGTKLYPRIFSTSWERVNDHQTGVNRTLIKPLTQFLVGYPIPYKPPSRRPMVVCLVQNAASARWKRLLLTSIGNVAAGEVSWDPVSAVEAPWLPRNLTELRAQVADANATRIMITRNPYVRLLSAFLSRAVKPPSDLWARIVRRHGGPYKDTPHEFARFVGNLLAMRENGSIISKQFSPTMQLCGLDNGMQYDLHLRLEQMEDWYADLVHLLGIEDYVRTGWSMEQPEGAEGSGDCFHMLEGMNCQETDVFLQMHGLGINRKEHQVQRDPEMEASWARVPSTREPDRVEELFFYYYNSQSIADLTTIFLEDDLTMFGYEELRLAPLEEVPASDMVAAAASMER